MWIRFNIKCHNCEKVTNVRLHITKTDKQEIGYKCPNCKSYINSTLNIHLQNKNIQHLKSCQNKDEKKLALIELWMKAKYTMDMHRGIKVADLGIEIDYYLEYSDRNPTRGFTTEPHGKLGYTPALRYHADYANGKELKDFRNNLNKDLWIDFIDLIDAFVSNNFELVKKISIRIGGRIIRYLDNSYLSHLEAFFTVINLFTNLYFDAKRYSTFIAFLSKELYESKEIFIKNGMNKLVLEYINRDSEQVFIYDCSQILKNFAKLHELFNSTLIGYDYNNSHYSIMDFNALKSLYSDIIEFNGKWSVLFFEIENLVYRKDKLNLPNDSPRDVKTINDFKRLSNGRKKQIIDNHWTSFLKDSYDKSFDIQLRNGINHYNTRIENQNIVYISNADKPEKITNIHYGEFLKKILYGLTTCMELFQTMKFLRYYNELKISK